MIGITSPPSGHTPLVEALLDDWYQSSPSSATAALGVCLFFILHGACFLAIDATPNPTLLDAVLWVVSQNRAASKPASGKVSHICSMVSTKWPNRRMEGGTMVWRMSALYMWKMYDLRCGRRGMIGAA